MTNCGDTTDEEIPALEQIQGLLLIACVFALLGGFLDAYSYLAHNHVFATAETGNVIFFAVYASGHNWPQAVRHVPPIGAFMLGAATARLLGAKAKKHSFRATLICQGLETAALVCLVLFAARLPGSWIVPMIAFCSALQNTSFGALGPWTFNSAMTTGNLRNGTSGLVLWWMGRSPDENRGRAIVSFSIVLSFFTGGLLGGFYTRSHPEHTLTPCVVLALAGMLLTWRQRVKYRAAERRIQTDDS